MVMIPMECPRCGRRGSVPSNRLNTPLNCKNCQAPFYLNSNGDPVLGEPRSLQADAQQHQAAPTKKKVEREFDFDFTARWKEMKPQEKKRTLLIGACVCLALLGFGVYLSSSAGDPLTDQAVYVAKLFADNDASRLRSVASEGTSEDAVKWLNKVRPESGIKGDSGKYAISSGIMTGGIRSGDAVVMTTFTPFAGLELSPDLVQDPRAGAFKDGAEAPPSSQLLALELYFKLDGRGYLRLDGSATLNASAKPTKSTKGSK